MLDRKVAPPFIQSTSFELIHPDKNSLANGVEVFFINGGSQEVLKIELILPAGRWFEKNWGASHFTAHLLAKGTATKTSFDIAQIFDLYGAHLEVNAGLDVVSISLYSLSKNLLPVLDLLYEILAQPLFSEKELAQSQSVFLQNLKINYEKTSFLASKHFRKSLFGEHHPYGKELEEADVNALNPEHLKEHYDACFQHFMVFVSGHIGPANEKHILDTFSRLKTKPVASKTWTSPYTTAAYEYVEKEGSVQSTIRMGRKSLRRSDPDYVAAVFTSHILGGYFGSRLMKNIREEKGLTYGIFASLHPLKNDSYLVIGADVNKENVALTFTEIKKELRKLREEKISASELETARNHFIGSLQSEITTPFAHADKWKTIYLFGLPATYYQEMIAKLESIRPEHIREISARYFDDETFFEIAVG
jgi:zinc protease